MREARRNVKGEAAGEGEGAGEDEDEGSEEVRYSGERWLLALARRDEGETRIDRYPPARPAR